jgi:hypothetical protein
VRLRQVSKVGLLTRVPSSQHTNTVSPGTKLISERHHCREAPHQHVHACPRLSRALLSTHLPRFATVQKSVFLCGGRDARVQYSVSCENKQVCGNAAGSPSPCTTCNPFLGPPPFRRPFTPPLPPRCTLSAKVWSPRPYTPHHGSTASTWPISTCRPLSPSQEWTPSGHSGPQRKCCMRWWRGVLATAVLQRFNASAIAFPQR